MITVMYAILLGLLWPAEGPVNAGHPSAQTANDDGEHGTGGDVGTVRPPRPPSPPNAQ